MKKALLIILICICGILYFPLVFCGLEFLITNEFNKDVFYMGLRFDLLVSIMIVLIIGISKLNDLIYKNY